jgi:hypothetical protein
VEFITPQPYEPSVWLPIHDNAYISQHTPVVQLFLQQILAISICHLVASYDDVFYVFYHQDPYLTFSGEVECHSEVFADFSLIDLHFSSDIGH